MYISFHQACLSIDRRETGRPCSDTVHLRHSDIGFLPMFNRRLQTVPIQEAASELCGGYGSVWKFELSPNISSHISVADA
jgi:hypothetical protein